MSGSLWDHAPVPDYDDDGEERRGRGRPAGSTKDKRTDLVKVSVELTPEALASIEEIKAMRRATGFPVGSRSEIICEALTGEPLRVATSLRAAFANCGDLLPAEHRAAALRLPHIEGVTIAVDARTATAIDVIYAWFRKQDRLFVSQAALVQAVLLDVSGSICAAEADTCAAPK